MSAAHDHEDLQRLLDRLSPEQARHLRVLAAADPQLHDLLEEPASSSDEGTQQERLLALAGIWDDGPLDAAERHDELIRERLAPRVVTAATIVDTGPLVALLNRNDAHHDLCVRLFASMVGEPLVPVTVMVEVCWLLEDRPDVEAEFLDAVAAGAFNLVQLTTADVTRTAELVRQYADFPLGAVDASVVAIAERLELREVVTLDRRHFSVVRPRHIPAFTLLPE